MLYLPLRISPLNTKYQGELQRIGQKLNNLRGVEVVQLREFENLGEFAEIMTDLALKSEPYKLSYSR